MDQSGVVPGQPVALETKIKCTEAVDNHVEEHTVKSFMELCRKYYLVPENLVIDMKFLKRISEGELRVFIIGKKPIYVIHKKPSTQSKDAFSATLFSGAKYTYQSPSEYP